MQKSALPKLQKLVKSDSKTLVQAAAIKALSTRYDRQNLPLFTEAIRSESYAVQGAALSGIALLDPDMGIKMAHQLEKDSRGVLTQAIVGIYSRFGDEKEVDYVRQAFDKGDIYLKFAMMRDYVQILSVVNDPNLITSEVSEIKKLAIQYQAQGMHEFLIAMLEDLKTKKKTKADAAEGELKAQLNSQAAFIANAIAEIKAKTSK